ncbi:hypothetical protein ACQ4PT_026288 [Festuca glaucescens]
MKMSAAVLLAAVVALLLVSTVRGGDDDCGSPESVAHDRARAKPLKIAAFFSILVCGALGCSLPVLGRRVPALRPDGDIFFLVKAFAAGGDPRHRDFPFAGLGAMVGAIGTLVVDTLATGYFTRAHMKKDAATGGGSAAVVDEEKQAAAAAAAAAAATEEGGQHLHAKFRAGSIVTMILFFCLTTPVGILVGMGISRVYNENSPTALVVEGSLNSVAAGILVYMALVDLLAEDFMNPKVQSRGKLQLGINVSMLLGAGLMSMLAKWA